MPAEDSSRDDRARTVYTRSYDTGRRELGVPVTVASTTRDTGRRQQGDARLSAKSTVRETGVFTSTLTRGPRRRKGSVKPDGTVVGMSGAGVQVLDATLADSTTGPSAVAATPVAVGVAVPVGADAVAASASAPTAEELNAAEVSKSLHSKEPQPSAPPPEALGHGAAPVTNDELLQGQSAPARSSAALVCLFLALVTTLLYLYLPSTQKIEVTVHSYSWTRSVDIEERRTASRDGWCNDVAEGAYDITSDRRYKETVQVPDGEECWEECGQIQKPDGEECKQECREVQEEEGEDCAQECSKEHVPDGQACHEECEGDECWDVCTQTFREVEHCHNVCIPRYKIVERCENTCRPLFKWVEECKTKCKTRYRPEKVYADYCHYTVDFWDFFNTVTAGGDSLADPHEPQQPYWPGARDDSCTTVGCKRTSKRVENYTARFSFSPGGGKSHKHVECSISQHQLERMRTGAVYQGHMFWGSLDCDSIAL